MSGIKIQKLDRWALELSDYNLNFVHIKGNENIFVDTILHLKSKKMYHEPLARSQNIGLSGHITC